MSTLRSRTIRLAHQNPELRPILLKALRETTVDGRVASDFPPEIRGSYPYLRTQGFSDSDFRVALIIAREFVGNLDVVTRRIIDEWKVNYKATTNIDEARRLVALMNDPVNGINSYHKALVAAKYGVASMAELEANLSKFQGRDFDEVKKWAARVKADMEMQNVTLDSLKRRTVIAFNALSKLVKANPIPKAPAPVMDPVVAPTPVPQEETKEDIRARVKSQLRYLRSGIAGRVLRVDEDSQGWTLDMVGRERLDHYGNDGDGWDSDAWEQDYAGPLREEAQAWLDKTFDKGLLTTDVGEKGHLEVEPNPRGAWKDLFKA